MKGVGFGLVLAMLAAPVAGRASDVVLGSGLEVRFHDVIIEPQSDGEIWMTLRFISPQIGQAPGMRGYEDVAGDLDWLCAQRGLPAAEDAGGVDQVLIALMDRAIERGVTDPDATVFIGAYLPTEGGCVWQ